MNLVLSDQQARLKFAPLTLTRPVGALRCGLFTNAERWQKWLPTAQIGFDTAEYLQTKFPKNEGVLVSAQLIPNEEVVVAIQALPSNTSLFLEDIWLATNGEALSKMSFTGERPIILNERWDLFQLNDAVLRADFKLATQQQVSMPLSESNLLIGPEDQLFIDEGAQIEGAILNTKEGPIYIAKNAEVMEGALLRGPIAILEGAVVKMGAKIYGATTIGPECRVGGEVSNCVLAGYSNKGHDGFIGNALLGEWCNLGADTNSSNLKNNYGLVNTYSYDKQAQVKTPLQFMGVCMGDHSKTAINVQFNTATVVGVSANIFCSTFPEKHIPSFSWVGDQTTEIFELEKAIEAAKAMMSRRKVPFTEGDQLIFETLFK